MQINLILIIRKITNFTITFTIILQLTGNEIWNYGCKTELL